MRFLINKKSLFSQQLEIITRIMHADKINDVSAQWLRCAVAVMVSNEYKLFTLQSAMNYIMPPIYEGLGNNK